MENKTCTYVLQMQTPLGRRRGSLTLHLAGERLTGTLTLFTRTCPICQGIRTGRNLSFQGQLPTLAGPMHCQVQGVFHENMLLLELTTHRGTYPVTGILTQQGGSKGES